MDSARIEAYVDAAAGALDLPIAAAHRPGVIAYFAIAAQLAEIVMAAPLAAGDEPAPVFVPIAPEDDAPQPGDTPARSGAPSP